MIRALFKRLVCVRLDFHPAIFENKKTLAWWYSCGCGRVEYSWNESWAERFFGS